MGSVHFREYDRNLRRIFMAELIDDQLHTKDAWRRLGSPRGVLFSDAVRAEIRAKLQLGAAGAHS